MSSAHAYHDPRDVIALVTLPRAFASLSHARQTYATTTTQKSTNMFSSIGNYFYERRAGYTKALGVTGGLYLVGRYVGERLESARRSMIEQRSAKEGCALGSFIFSIY